MAVSPSKLVINQTLPKRGQIKIKIFKIIAKSLKELANGVAGGENKAAGKGDNGGECCHSTASMIPEETVRGLISRGSERAIRQNRPRRGQIKVKIIKMLAKSLKDLTIQVARRNKKTASGCFHSPATVIPVDHLGELESVIDIEESRVKEKEASGGRIPMVGTRPMEW